MKKKEIIELVKKYNKYLIDSGYESDRGQEVIDEILEVNKAVCEALRKQMWYSKTCPTIADKPIDWSDAE